MRNELKSTLDQVGYREDSEGKCHRCLEVRGFLRQYCKEAVSGEDLEQSIGEVSEGLHEYHDRSNAPGGHVHEDVSFLQQTTGEQAEDGINPPPLADEVGEEGPHDGDEGFVHLAVLVVPRESGEARGEHGREEADKERDEDVAEEARSQGQDRSIFHDNKCDSFQSLKT